jgi:hypothetical protein
MTTAIRCGATWHARMPGEAELSSAPTKTAASQGLPENLLAGNQLYKSGDAATRITTIWV